MFREDEQQPEAVAVGDYLIPTDPADLTQCDSCQ